MKRRTLAFIATLSIVTIGSVFLFSTASGKPKTEIGEGSLPGAQRLDKGLLKQFEQTRKEKGSDYRPRTRHLRPDGSAKYTNRLFLQISPYLIQHAHNPVNWYPWGDEAFETAKKLKRPVLLSVGYSTCHWCHVMEEESFEDEDVARVMNENYIAIKVDREERPDIDAIYMSAVQAMTGSGGWPMTVWLAPDRKPFFGGTYFPARDGDRGAGTGFVTLLKKLKEAFDKEPSRVAEAGQKLSQAIERNLSPQSGGQLPETGVLTNAIKQYKARFDSTEGSLSSRMKFPSSLPNRFLFRYFRRAGDKDVLKMATLTLTKMAGGGMYDHVGGGFHRYSTDPKWIVPHFEKMLYDNALLVLAYLDGYQVTQNKDFERIVREILRYVERDMTSKEGAFYSATDADSLTPSGHRDEGYFFTWTPKEIDDILGKKESAVTQAYYVVTPSGNFEGRNILNTPAPLKQVAKKHGLGETEARSLIDQAREKLYQARLKRPAPLRDEKILTAWNALMISAHAQSGLTLGEPKYTERAERAARFILTNLYKKGRLLRSYKDGKAQLNGYLEDYSFFIAALLDLFEATGRTEWLKNAITLDRTLEKHYADKSAGGFFMTSDDHEKLLAREKPADDGAVPSGNSIAALNLLRLHELTTNDDYRKRAESILKAFSGTLTSQPVALSELLLAIDFHLDKPKEIVVVSPEGKRETAEPFLTELRRHFVPNRVLALVSEGKDQEILGAFVPLVTGKVAQQGKTTAYVCEKGICQFPTSDPKRFSELIKK